MGKLLNYHSSIPGSIVCGGQTIRPSNLQALLEKLSLSFFLLRSENEFRVIPELTRSHQQWGLLPTTSLVAWPLTKYLRYPGSVGYTHIKQVDKILHKLCGHKPSFQTFYINLLTCKFMGLPFRFIILTFYTVSGIPESPFSHSRFTAPALCIYCCGSLDLLHCCKSFNYISCVLLHPQIPGGTRTFYNILFTREINARPFWCLRWSFFQKDLCM